MAIEKPRKAKKAPDRTPLDDKPLLIKNLIKAYQRNVGNTRQTAKSREWFYKRASKLGTVRPDRMFKDKDNRQRDKVQLGKLYYFKYDAIHKEELPYWDQYPLVFFFDAFKSEKNGKSYLLGLNLHYLPPKMRLALFAELVKIRSEKRFRKNTKLKMTWSYLATMSKHNLVRPCVKMYRVDHIKTRFVQVPADEWEIVIPLQLSVFKKASRQQVWKDSMRKRK